MSCSRSARPSIPPMPAISVPSWMRCARLAELAGQGIGAAIIDAVFDSDLETIGAVAADHRLSVGASGIGLGLARALVKSGKVKAAGANAGSGAAVGGPAACLAGSCSQ